MTSRKSMHSFAKAVFFIFFLTFSTTSHGIDQGGLAPAPTTVRPGINATSKVIPNPLGITPRAIDAALSGAQCVMESVSPAAAETGDMVTITGKGIGKGCSAYFKNPSGGAYATNVQIIDPHHMSVVVPVMASGAGNISMHDRNNPVVNVNSTANILPFQVKAPVPALQSVTPGQAQPGEKITLIGSNLRQGEPYKAHFVTSQGKRIEAPLEWMNVTTFRVTVPDPSKVAGYQDTMQNADKFHVTRGSMPSNRVSFKILPAAKCVVKSIYPSIGNAKEHVWISGDSLSPACEVTFYTATGQPYPCTQKLQSSGGKIEVVIPNMPGSKGTVSSREAGAPQPAATIPYEVRAAVALLATRADVSYLQAIGTKIMGSPYAKTYSGTGYTSAPPQYPFECISSWSVFKNGDVYTYEYTIWIKEFVNTVRVLDRIRLIWPDLDNPALKYGTVSTSAKLTPELARKVVTTSEHRLEIDFWTNRGGLSTKTMSVYLQSKKPPVMGSVETFDNYGQVCTMNDAMIPAP